MNNTLSIEDAQKLSYAGNTEKINEDVVFVKNLHKLPTMDIPCRLQMAVLCSVVNGSLSLDVNLKNYVVQKNQVLLVMPNQMLVLRGESPDFMGFGIVGSVKVFNEVLTHITVNLPNYFEARLLSIPDELVQIGDLYYQLIEKTISRNQIEAQKEILHGLLHSLFYEILSLLSCQEGAEDSSVSSRKALIAQKFIYLLQHNYNKEHGVQFYADKLCISSKHLSRVLKDLNGMSANEVIDDYIIRESQILLRSSQLTVQEISNELNFCNQSFFGKFFKHHVGMSPLEYRRKSLYL
jgi:AraC family transcriptional regulator, transcriptional activator of pobA